MLPPLGKSSLWVCGNSDEISLVPASCMKNVAVNRDMGATNNVHSDYLEGLRRIGRALTGTPGVYRIFPRRFHDSHIKSSPFSLSMKPIIFKCVFLWIFYIDEYFPFDNVFVTRILSASKGTPKSGLPLAALSPGFLCYHRCCYPQRRRRRKRTSRRRPCCSARCH